MPRQPRSQPFRVSHPLNAQQAENIDYMFQLLFDDIRNNAVNINITQISGTLPISNGGTGSAGPFTEGSVLFVGAGGLAFAQNNGNFFWDRTLLRLGVGTNTPGAGIAYNAASKLIAISGDGSASVSAHGILTMENNRATPGVGDGIGQIDFTSKNNGLVPQGVRLLGLLEGAGGANGFGANFRIDTKDDNSALGPVERLRVTGSGLLTFQGVAATNPALKRSGIILQARLGDDSAYAPFEASILRFGDGTSSAPSLALTSATNTGWYVPAAGFFSLVFTGNTRHLWGGTEYRVGSGVEIGWSTNANPELAGADVSLARGGSNVLLMKNAVLFQLVGSTSSFPALKRSAATIQVRLADDSADAELQSLRISTNNAATFHTSRATLTNGAGVATGTLNTAPTAGDPTKWIGIDDNGTTRYIPAW